MHHPLPMYLRHRLRELPIHHHQILEASLSRYARYKRWFCRTTSFSRQVFWTWGWNAVLVSEEIKNALEAAHITGAKFIEV